MEKPLSSSERYLCFSRGERDSAVRWPLKTGCCLLLDNNINGAFVELHVFPWLWQQLFAALLTAEKLVGEESQTGNMPYHCAPWRHGLSALRLLSKDRASHRNIFQLKSVPASHFRGPELDGQPCKHVLRQH